MQPAAFGLTCKEAMAVFTANETLQLQAQVRDLQAQVEALTTQLKELQSPTLSLYHDVTVYNGQVGVCPYGLDVFTWT